MNLENSEYVIKFDHKELYMLACCIRRCLEDSIKNHYNNLQGGQDGEQIFNNQEATKISMMNTLLELIGYKHLSESFMVEFKRLFDQKRKERAEIK